MTGDPMFQVIYDGPHGPSVKSENPEIAAIAQVNFYRRIGVQNPRLFLNDDDSWTVTGDDMMSITFEKEDDNAPGTTAQQ